MKRACVIGWPIAHSRSPLIHGHWLKTHNIDGAYTKEPVEPDAITDFLLTLQQRGFVGCNVTVPHKEAAFTLAEIKHASATAVGAANTIWLENGKLACANTDTYGFMTNLSHTAPEWQQNNGPMIVLGAGGSARAVIYGFVQANRRDIRIFNRSLDRARELAQHFGTCVSAYHWDTRNEHTKNAAMIVNTTTLGMNGVGDPGIDFANVNQQCVVADLVYVPMETKFLQAAKARGLTTVGGLGMLLHQAVPGFEKWFGVRPEVTDDLVRLITRDVESA